MHALSIFRVPSKVAIGRLFGAGVALVVAGSAGGAAIVAWAVASGGVRLGGPQVLTLDPGLIAGAVIGLALASLLALAGTLAALASWVAALANTARLQDKTWFISLLGLGLASFGWAAMAAYLAAGPDSTSIPAGA